MALAVCLQLIRHKAEREESDDPAGAALGLTARSINAAELPLRSLPAGAVCAETKEPTPERRRIGRAEQRGSQLQQSSGADKLSLPSGAFVSSLATQPPA